MIIIRHSVTPQLHCYTILWNINVRKLVTVWNKFYAYDESQQRRDKTSHEHLMEMFYRPVLVQSWCLLCFDAVGWAAGRQEGHPACKNLSGGGAGVVICLERGADLRMAQLMPLPLTVSCFSKIQIGLPFWYRLTPGSPGQRAVKRVCVCVLVQSVHLQPECRYGDHQSVALSVMTCWI